MITISRYNPDTDSHEFWRTGHMSVAQWTGLTVAQRLSFLDDLSNLSQGRFESQWPPGTTARVHNLCKVMDNGKSNAGVFAEHFYPDDHWLFQPAKPRRPVVEYNFCPPKEKKAASRSKKTIAIDEWVDV